ncbi:MAG: hypothetical protein RL648_1157 [Verrucomicrobiota bacterium]|jgi:phosphatidate cytidylyltransferase
MKGRIFSTLILWSVAIGVPLLLGQPGLLALILLAALPSLQETLTLLKKSTRPADAPTAFIALTAFLGLTMVFPPTLLPPSLLWAGLVPLILMSVLLRSPTGEFVQRVGSTSFAFLLLAVPSFSAIWLIQAHGAIVILWVIAITKFGDVGALLTGMAIGRHKMAPSLSPKKTWEGLVGGVCASVLVSVAMVLAPLPHWPPALTVTSAALAAIFVSLSGVLGDLMESALKREANVKDSGSVFPGLGGFLDVADSLLLAIPVAHLLLWSIAR